MKNNVTFQDFSPDSTVWASKRNLKSNENQSSFFSQTYYWTIIVIPLSRIWAIENRKNEIQLISFVGYT